VLEPGGVVGGRAELKGRDDAVLGFLGDVVCVVKVGEDAGSIEVRTEEQAADRGGEAGELGRTSSDGVAGVGVSVREGA
jgi:hypothetical protein